MTDVCQGGTVRIIKSQFGIKSHWGQLGFSGDQWRSLELSAGSWNSVGVLSSHREVHWDLVRNLFTPVMFLCISQFVLNREMIY